MWKPSGFHIVYLKNFFRPQSGKFFTREEIPDDTQIFHKNDQSNC